MKMKSSSIGSWIRLVVLGFGLSIWAIPGQAQSSSIPLDSLGVLRGNNWQFSIQLDQRSNAIHHALGKVFWVGGALHPEDVAAARNEMTSGGTLGLRAGISFATEDVETRKGWQVESSVISDFRWTPEFWDLVFEGNSPHLGRFDVLNGTGGRIWQLNAVMRTGLWEREHNSLRWGLGLAHRPAGVDGSVSTGYFWVSDDVDSLFTSLYGRSTVLRAQALGLTGQIQFRHNDPASLVDLTLQVNHLGALWAGAGDERIIVDTLLETTGLPLQGAGWSLETLQGEGFGESLIHRDTLSGRLEALPTSFSMSLTGSIVPGLVWEVRGTVGGWRPVPEAMAGFQFKMGPRVVGGVRAIYGGWGKFRPAVWAGIPLGLNHALTLYAEDPLAAFQPSGLGRGLGIQLSKTIPTSVTNR